MTAIGESGFDDDGALGLAEWLQNEEVAGFQRGVEERIVQFLFNSNPEDAQFVQTIQMLAWIGCPSSERAFLQREIASLNGLDESGLIACGFCKNLWKTSCKVGRFIADHKTEILIGAALCATGVGLAVATGYTCSVVAGGAVVAGAGSIFTKEDPPKRIPTVPPPSSKEEIALIGQSPFPTLPKLELPSSDTEFLVTADGIWANGQFFSNQDLMQKSLFVKEFGEWAPANERVAAQKEAPSRSLPVPEAVAVPLVLAPAPYEGTRAPQPGSAVFAGGTKPLISIPFKVEGKRPSSAYIGWINGMDNTFEESKASANYIQTLSGGLTISGIYNCTHGIVVDVVEAALLNHQGFSPNTASLLQTEWRAFHEANKDRPNAKLLQICHSQGTIHVKNALTGSSLEIRERVIVVAIAPGAIVPKRLCFKSYNYASEKDFVYKLEPFPLPVVSLTIDDVIIPTFGEAMDDRGELIILVPHPGAEGIDHAVQSPTYQYVLKKIIEIYEANKGEFLLEEKGKLK